MCRPPQPQAIIVQNTNHKKTSLKNKHHTKQKQNYNHALDKTAISHQTHSPRHRSSLTPSRGPCSVKGKNFQTPPAPNNDDHSLRHHRLFQTGDIRKKIYYGVQVNSVTNSFSTAGGAQHTKTELDNTKKVRKRAHCSTDTGRSKS
ncbi:unnamed protein product [Ectocarpus fasciculatus]